MFDESELTRNRAAQLNDQARRYGLCLLDIDGIVSVRAFNDGEPSVPKDFVRELADHHDELLETLSELAHSPARTAHTTRDELDSRLNRMRDALDLALAEGAVTDDAWQNLSGLVEELALTCNWLHDRNVT